MSAPLAAHHYHRGGSTPRRHATVFLAACLCVGAAVAIWGLLTGDFDETRARVLASAVVGGLCTLAGLTGSLLVDRSDPRGRLGRATVALAAVDASLALVVIWSLDGEGSDTALRAFGVASALLVAASHACLMISRLRHEDARAVGTLSGAAIALAAAAALLLGSVFAFATGPVDPAMWRLFGVLLVLALLATLLTPLVRKASRPRGDDTD